MIQYGAHSDEIWEGAGLGTSFTSSVRRGPIFHSSSSNLKGSWNFIQKYHFHVCKVYHTGCFYIWTGVPAWGRLSQRRSCKTTEGLPVSFFFFISLSLSWILKSLRGNFKNYKLFLTFFSFSLIFFRRMMGKELDGLSFKELQHLEHLLSEGILSVKDKKVSSYQVFIPFLNSYYHGP